jgi:ferredoxin
MTKVAMTVNGRAVYGEVEGRTLLVQFLRENLRLTGTHVGCDTSQCGACVVHLDGKAVKSCTTLALSRPTAPRDDDRGPRQGRRPASDAGRLPRASRPAMRLLHAGHDHVGGRHREPPRRATSTRRRSARSSKAISAAAPATTTSSRRSPPDEQMAADCPGPAGCRIGLFLLRRARRRPAASSDVIPKPF